MTPIFALILGTIQGSVELKDCMLHCVFNLHKVGCCSDIWLGMLFNIGTTYNRCPDNLRAFLYIKSVRASRAHMYMVCASCAHLMCTVGIDIPTLHDVVHTTLYVPVPGSALRARGARRREPGYVL